MTINYARESVIDFTKPFMNLGIGILFKVKKIINKIYCYLDLFEIIQQKKFVNIDKMHSKTFHPE